MTKSLVSPGVYHIFCLRTAALHALQIRDARGKTAATLRLARLFANKNAASSVFLDCAIILNEPSGLPCHPPQLKLVHPIAVKKRNLRTPAGLAAMIHALAHIEMNAVNLALDAIWRFPNMPPQYYADWLSVAREEAYHFRMLARRLQTLGMAYADLPAHDGLWDMTHRTRHDVCARMALVPRLLEARGLDAAPAVIHKLMSVGDAATAAVVSVILRDEVRHVAIGNHWYAWCCAQADLEPVAHFATLLELYDAPLQKPPFNLEARRAAGFTEAELLALQTSHVSLRNSL